MNLGCSWFNGSGLHLKIHKANRSIDFLDWPALRRFKIRIPILPMKSSDQMAGLRSRSLDRVAKVPPENHPSISLRFGYLIKTPAANRVSKRLNLGS